MRANSVARRYARAVFEVAREKGDPEEWLPRLQAVAEATSSPDLAGTLRNPNVSDLSKTEAIENSFSGLPAELRNLIRLLIVRGRIDILPGICVAFAEYLDELLGRVDAHVTSARTLSAHELEVIQNQLSKRTGRTVTARASVDKSLIGGVVIRIGDEVIDASVATRLDRLRQRLV